MARHFFIEQSNIHDNTIIFSEDDIRHFISIRLEDGDILTCIEPLENNAHIYTILVSKNGKRYTGFIKEKKDLAIQYKKKIHILQCIPKLDKLELILQKVSELGGYEIVPLFSHNTDIKGKIGENKLSRWQKIAKESSIQSGRMDIIRVQNPLSLSEFLIKNKEKLLAKSSYAILLNEGEKDITLHHITNEIISPEIQDVFVLIGAEGGFQSQEIQTCIDEYCFKSITLGSNILRTETAPIAITAILQYIISS